MVTTRSVFTAFKLCVTVELFFELFLVCACRCFSRGMERPSESAKYEYRRVGFTRPSAC